MNSKTIKRYSKKTIPELKRIATRHFNAYIRKRDEGNKCISCDAQGTEAGHFYSAGHYSALRYNENNVHIQCSVCNRHLSANLLEYRQGLIKKIGEKEVLKLEETAAYHKRHGYKWDRFFLISVIEKYKQLNQTK